MPSFQSIWKIVKIFMVIQIINAFIDYYVWVAEGFLIPSWVIATISVFYVTLVWALKVAQEKEAATSRGNCPK